METVKCIIRKHKGGALPKDPASLRDLIINKKSSKFEGKDFHIDDNGIETADRVLVFGTGQGLNHLGFMDGIFSKAAK